MKAVVVGDSRSRSRPGFVWMDGWMDEESFGAQRCWNERARRDYEMTGKLGKCLWTLEGDFDVAQRVNGTSMMQQGLTDIYIQPLGGGGGGEGCILCFAPLS